MNDPRFDCRVSRPCSRRAYRREGLPSSGGRMEVNRSPPRYWERQRTQPDRECGGFSYKSARREPCRLRSARPCSHLWTGCSERTIRPLPCPQRAHGRARRPRRERPRSRSPAPERSSTRSAVRPALPPKWTRPRNRIGNRCQLSSQECGHVIGCAGDEFRVVVETDLALRLEPKRVLGRVHGRIEGRPPSTPVVSARGRPRPPGLQAPGRCSPRRGGAPAETPAGRL
jgi:hypothetical protein